MVHALLVQLPVPRLNYGVHTGNIPLGAACLKQAARRVPGAQVDILPESIAAYVGDAALLEILLERKPDVIGFTVYCWNLERSLYFAQKLKQLTASRIVFGGPEITPDNPAVMFMVKAKPSSLNFLRIRQPGKPAARRSRPERFLRQARALIC